MVDFAAGFGNKSSTTLIRQLVAVDFVADTVNFVANMVDFVTSVYGPKQHGRLCLLSFNKVDRVDSTLLPVCTGLYSHPLLTVKMFR